MTEQRGETPDEPVTPGMAESAGDEDTAGGVSGGERGGDDREGGPVGTTGTPAEEMGGATGITGGGESARPGEGVESTDHTGDTDAPA
jgi:hypothetical protein